MPAGIRSDHVLDLPPAAAEDEVLAELRRLAGHNRVLTSMIGLGYADTVTPPVIRRGVLESPGWYTAYTPYQPEISQGRLEALLNFQTAVADLTALPVANASLLDEPTAAAEAMSLCRRVSKSTSRPLHRGPRLPPADDRGRPHPGRADRARGRGRRPVRRAAGRRLFGVLVAYPGSSGAVRDRTEISAAAHDRGAVVAVTTDLLALTLLRPPGEWGADVAVGSAQRFGVPMGFGGPHAGFMAVRKGLERALPGRLVGVSVDADGAPAYRLALQTREQHIRREKATSNICTAQVLLAVVAGMYAVWHGPEGLTRIAERVHRHAARLGPVARRRRDRDRGRRPGSTPSPRGCPAARARWSPPPSTGASTCASSTRTRSGSLRTSAPPTATSTRCARRSVSTPVPAGEPAHPHRLARQSPFLTHPVFHEHRSETAMMRYLRRLADRDLALDRTMIPLGSCTMKLNAAAEMEPITWPEIAGIHPFAPSDQAAGHLRVIHDLETWLAELTGYDAVSVQPNAGSQGEFAGLLAIRAYLRDRGEGHRDICLIPSSAHGTNAASAAMAGMRVVVVGCDDAGNVSVDDLRAKIAANADRIAALMVTYPSTHGVFEADIAEVCAAVHDAGGQVYVDGANLNALLGLARPGRFGADVSHLNLHKTFCIPHGGGGPGVGPVAVREHLAPYLPNHPLAPEAGPDTGVGPISGAPWGSAGILPISWAYVRLMGAAGLTEATEVAVLSANYLARRLAPHYPVLYTGRDGLVAHECIVDVRGITRETGVTVEDIAKRLIDYGFHAPTMSFPVAGTLMIEPTESEDLTELDRFCDAMIAIRAEIERVAAGEWPAEDNPLRNAPHTAAMAVGDWDRPYSRELAVFPAGSRRTDKYWPPVRRIDQGYGDRNLFCSCPAL